MEKTAEEKEMELISKNRDLSNAIRELELNKGQYNEVLVKKAFLVREMELTEKQTSLAMSNWELLKPTWKFEADQDYVELGRQFAQLNFEKKMFNFNLQLQQMEQLLHSLNEQYKSIEEHKVRLEAKIKELQGEENDRTN